MKKLIVCGDSFMSPSIDQGYQHSHFSEIFASYYDFDLTAYSRGAMSNGGIAIQIETAISQKPDFIFVGNSFHHRTEMKLSDEPVEKFTIDNILYDTPQSLSCTYDWINQNPVLLISTITSIESSKFKNPMKSLALSGYFKQIYHNDWKLQLDSWILYAVFHKLHLSGIPYFIIFDNLRIESIDYPWLTDKTYLARDVKEIYLKYPSPAYDPGYHTSKECQQKIAEYLIEKYKEIY